MNQLNFKGNHHPSVSNFSGDFHQPKFKEVIKNFILRVISLTEKISRLIKYFTPKNILILLDLIIEKVEKDKFIRILYYFII